MLTKHDDHQCREGMEKLPKCLQLLKHIAKHHNDDESDTKVFQFKNRLWKKKFTWKISNGKNYKRS